MPVRPSRLWKDLSVEARLPLAEAFWQESDDTDVQMQHMEATAALARRLNFRVKSIMALPLERRAKYLAQMGDVSETVATRALIAYHLAAKRPLMGAFLDALGIAHEDGVITVEEVPKPDKAQLEKGVEAIRAAFPAGDVDLYLRTLEIIDGDTWGEIHAFLPASP
jgi:hypothetical protein